MDDAKGQSDSAHTCRRRNASKSREVTVEVVESNESQSGRALFRRLQVLNEVTTKKPFQSFHLMDCNYFNIQTIYIPHE
jgi:hypothetical protein